MNNKILIALIFLVTPLVVADTDLFDEISYAIGDSDVVLTKSLVRQLDDQVLTPQEKKKALSLFARQAKDIVEAQPSLRVAKSFRDTYNFLLPSLGIPSLAIGCLTELFKSKEEYERAFRESSELMAPINEYKMKNSSFIKLSNLISTGLSLTFTVYQWKKGWGCYHQRKTYDKALRIEKWLKEENEKLSS